jgi:hypothetical protein
LDQANQALVEKVRKLQADSDLANESRSKCWKQNQVTIATLEVALAQTRLTLAQATLDKLQDDQ